MALVNWKLLDKEYQAMRDVLVAKSPVGKIQMEANKSAITEAMEWDAFLASAKPKMPVAVRELLETLSYADATKAFAVNRFAASVCELWPDVREEVKRLESDNETMVEERHLYRRSSFAKELKKS
jgi:hypothetical protein